MTRIHVRITLAVAAAIVGLASAAKTPTAVAPQWQKLWNGKDLSGWETYMATPDPAWDVPGMTRGADGKYTEPLGRNRDPLGVFKVEEVEGRPAIHISGQGFGVMTTDASFENYRLRLQFKWGEKRWGSKSQAARDSGLLYHCHGEQGAIDKNWPRSVEMQIQEHDTGDLWAVGTQIRVRARKNDAPRPLFVYDPQAEPVVFEQKPPTGNRCVKLEDREKPNGEWNTLELIALGDASIHVVNGVVVMRLADARRVDGAEPSPLTSGRISLQTEGAELFYRDVEIQKITSVPAEYAARP